SGDNASQRLAAIMIRQAHRQLGVVRARRLGPNQDGVGLVAAALNPATRLLTGDPARLPAGGGDLAVQSHGHLDLNEWHAGCDALDERFVELAGFRLQKADMYLQTAISQMPKAGAGYQRIRILHRG